MTKYTHPLDYTRTVQVRTADFSSVQIHHAPYRIPWHMQSSLSAVANVEKTCLCVLRFHMEHGTFEQLRSAVLPSY